MDKYTFINQYDHFYIVRRNFPDVPLKENESQYTILSKSQNRTFNPNELCTFIEISEEKAIERALQYARANGLL
jgi:hypothetical protein